MRMRNRNSDIPLIYCLDYLNLDKEAREIAENLQEQTDMPIVFWLDSDISLSIGARHPKQNNQYWIIIPPRAEEDERRRLILGGMYRAVQETNRYWRFKCYEESEELHQLAGAIGSVATSIDVACFLEKYNIRTDAYILNIRYKNEKKILRRYIGNLKAKKYAGEILWKKEKEFYHIIQCGDFYQRNVDFRKELEYLTKQIGNSFFQKMILVAEQIAEMKSKYDGTNGNILTEELMRKWIHQFDLEERVRLFIPDYYESEYPVEGGMAPVFSYIPESCPEQKELMRWLRLTRQIICHYRSMKGFEEPDVLVNIIDTDVCNTYADGTVEKGYCIGITTGLVRLVNHVINDMEILDGLKYMVDAYGEAGVRKQLMRMVIYFTAAHEYAHILAGDCDETERCRREGITIPEETRNAWEEKADKLAREIISVSVMNEHRFPPAPEGEHQRIGQALRNGGIEAMESVVSEDRRWEISREVAIQQLNLLRDRVLMDEAEQFIRMKVRGGRCGEIMIK